MERIHYELLATDHVKKIGLIVLQTDVTLEDEFRYYFANQPVSIMANRIPFETEVKPGSLMKMENYLGETMSLFPLDTEFDAVGYCCTSGALHIGSERIAELVKQERHCEMVIDPLSSAVSAMSSIGAKNIAYLGPYSEQVCSDMVKYFASEGIDVSAAASYDEVKDRLVGRISPASIKRDAINLAKNNPQIDAVFIACTNMKCAHVIPEIEAETGVTVMSSNQVMAWDLAKHIGVALGADKGTLLQ